MMNILNDPLHTAQLLTLAADCIFLVDQQGICKDALFNLSRPLNIKTEDVVEQNIFQLMPRDTADQMRKEHEQVLTYRCASSKDFKWHYANRSYYFECNMSYYEGMAFWVCNDVTDKMRHSLQLEHKIRQLREIEKAAAIGLWKYNMKQRFFTYHGETRVLSKQQKQTIGRDEYLQMVLPEDRESLTERLEAYLHGELELSADFRMRWEGNIFYMHMKCYSCEVLTDGNVILEGYLQNITELQRNRNDISLLTHAINNSTEDIFAAKADGQLLFANRKFRDHHGIPHTTDITTLHFADLTSSPDNPEVWENLKKSILRGQENNTFIVYNPLKDDPNVLAYEGNAYWITSDDGDEVLWAFGHDVSQRIRNERQIHRLSLILNKVVESLPAGIVVKDPQKGFSYLYRNKESHNRQLSGLPQEAIGHTDFEFYPEEVAREKRKQDEEVMATGQEMHWLAEESDIDGNLLYLDKRKMRIGGDNCPPFLLSIEWNITEMEQMRRELVVAKKKAETSDQLKSAFLANMSHEIRTPLNAIVGFSRLIAESEEYAERRMYYQIVEANNDRLLSLINEILDLSKIEANMVEFIMGPVRLQTLFEEVYQAHLLRCPEEVALVNDADPDHDVVIHTDKNRLFQVISNLIGNAFKFTTHGAVTFGYRIEGKRVSFYVKDTGTGIPKEKLASVFDRFVKANNFVQGTGLGLSISKTIIEKLQGEISVTSEVDKGTTFSFYLPLPEEEIELVETEVQAESTATRATTQRPARPRSSKEHKPLILAAEDVESNYTLLRATLSKRYRLEWAKDGIEAVRMNEELHPDLILMDMKMPNLDGLQATAIIHEVSDVPIIALTAFAFDSDRVKALEAGCVDFMTKPFTPERLYAMIEKYLPEADNG